MKHFRFREVGVLVYRILLAYGFYQVARLLFFLYNKEFLGVKGLGEYLKLAYYGTAFDTTAILYVNALFILLSLLPLTVNTSKGYQRMLFWLYFVTNGIAYAMNFGDFIYYRFSQSRLTSAVLDVVANETNLWRVFGVSLLEHFELPLLFGGLLWGWVWLYKRVKIEADRPAKLGPYLAWSIVTLCVTAALVVGGIRGDFKHSTRPINLVDANRHTENPVQANLVLNSTFSFFRTIDTNNFQEVHFVDEDFIKRYVKPYKHYEREVPSPRPNIVIFIVESFGREYSGAFNRGKGLADYVSYTPFIDSLAGESLIFTNMYANGRQSIHGMSSVLAGIPSLKDAFTSSPYSNQKIQSIVSVCNDLGYSTSFYHGAPNGSMGFQGFANILGFNRYYGMTEYGNDADFDGMWAIWDEPFLQYFAKNVGQEAGRPFMATVFTASSHHPFKIPEKYKGKFKKGTIEMHEPIQYTDYALRNYFETAKKQPWFHNTIFVITGDHTNQVFYPEYEKAMNRFALPLLLYSPNPRFHLQGVRETMAQQADIYPTLADLIGYNQPIRSWGRSLVADDTDSGIIVNSDGVQEQFIIGSYIYRFDGREVTGVYLKSDLGLENNLLGHAQGAEIERGKKLCKAWYQDYMHRVIRRKLY
ncbi:LTA synthase family protein [Bergeyella sp. RCAD1439]|uniref:LTA synthase family protein n=1 Tax=Bergeyella anatis TaxID=3113737 RepID=UPI002E19DE11|nr:LTA synthase family protein [Bergeyella sp. RCAD1439]